MAFFRDQRDMWAQLHKWSGLATCLFIVMVALTGSILVFRAGLDAALNRDLFITDDARPALSLPEIIGRAEQQRPEMRVILAVPEIQKGRTVKLDVSPRDDAKPLSYNQVFAEPATGAVVGDRMLKPGWGPRHILAGVYELHVRLLMGEPARILMGVIAGVWFVSSLVGIYLTFPRVGPFWSKWRKIWKVKAGSKLPRLALDVHRATGLWLSVCILAIAGSGFFITFYEEITEPVVQVVSRPAFTEPPGKAVAAGEPVISYDQAIQSATRGMQKDQRGLKLAVVFFDEHEGSYTIGFSGSGRRDYWWLGPVYYFVDARTGQVVGKDDPYLDSPGRIFQRLLFPIHSGRVLGWTTRILLFLTGLAVAVMTVAGVYVWLRKRQARLAGTRPAQADGPVPTV